MREINLTNGIKTCFKRNLNTPRIAFSMNFSIVHPEKNAGQYLLMNRLLMKGTQQYSSEELSGDVLLSVLSKEAITFIIVSIFLSFILFDFKVNKTITCL